MQIIWDNLFYKTLRNYSIQEKLWQKFRIFVLLYLIKTKKYQTTYVFENSKKCSSLIGPNSSSTDISNKICNFFVSSFWVWSWKFLYRDCIKNVQITLLKCQNIQRKVKKRNINYRKFECSQFLWKRFRKPIIKHFELGIIHS